MKHLALWVLHNMFFDGEVLLAPRPTPKLEDHPSSAVRDCLFNRFAATLHIGGRSSIRNLRTRHAVVTGTHLSHGMLDYIQILFHFVCKQLSPKSVSTPNIPSIIFHVFSAPLKLFKRIQAILGPMWTFGDAERFAVLSLRLALQMQDVTSLAHSDSPFSTSVAIVYIYWGRLQKNCPFFSIGVKAASFFEEET